MWNYFELFEIRSNVFQLLTIAKKNDRLSSEINI